MNKCLIVSIVCSASIALQAAENSGKNNRFSDRGRRFLSASQQNIEREKERDASPLSHSAPIAIPKKNDVYLLHIAGSPKTDEKKLSFGDYFQSFQGYSPSPSDYGSKR